MSEAGVDLGAIRTATKATASERHAKRTPDSFKKAQDKWDANPNKSTWEKEAAKREIPAADIPTPTETPERGGSQDTLIQETRKVAHAAISEKAEQVANSGDTSGYGENILAGIHLVNTCGEGTELPYKPDDSLKFKRGDQDMEMVGATANQDGTFSCSIQVPGDPESSEITTFTKTQLIDAIITSDTRSTNEVINLLPESQRELVGLYVDIVENGESALAGKTSEQVGKMITGVADELEYFITTDTLRMWNPKPGDNAPEAEKKAWEEFDLIFSQHKLADGAMLAKILQNPVMYQHIIQNAKHEIKILRKASSNKDDLDYAGKAADELKTEEIWLAKLEAIKNNGPEEVQKVFDDAMKGNTKQKLIDINRALKNGDQEAVFRTMGSAIHIEEEDKPGDTDEQRAVKAEKRKKRGINLTILLLGLLGTGIGKAGEFTGSELGGR